MMVRPQTIDFAPFPPELRDEKFAASPSTRGYVQATKAGQLTVVDLFGTIGTEQVNESTFAAALREAEGDVLVRINSPGGLAYTGLTIFNLLVRHSGRVRIEIVGMAASAASIVAMAGDEIAIAESGQVMIHNAWVLTIGDQRDHAESVELLEKLDAALAGIYARRSGRSEGEIRRLMDKTTYFTADEALEAGLVTEIMKGIEARNDFDLKQIYASWAAENSDAADDFSKEARKLIRKIDEMSTKGATPAESMNAPAARVAALISTKPINQERNVNLEALASEIKNATADIASLKATVGVPDRSRPGKGPISAAYANELAALGKFCAFGDDSVMASMSVGSDADGGYLDLPVLSDQFSRRLADAMPMRRLARGVTIKNSGSFQEITDFGKPQTKWVGETESRPKTDTPKLGRLEIQLNEIESNAAASARLLDDAGTNIAEWLIEHIVQEFAREEGEAFLIGDGVLKPRGLLNYPTSTEKDDARASGTLQIVKSGDGAGLPASDPAGCLKSLVWAVRAPYRVGASFLMNSATAGAIDRITDDIGRPLWRDSLREGAPATLLGYPVEIDETMPDIGANTTPVAYGSFSRGYTILDRPGIRLLRDPFTEKGFVLFYVTKRVGGGVQNFEAIKLLKIAA
jgi:HK97 family phage major capsid protein